MKKPQVPDRENWDAFVQKHLIEPLHLDDVVIHVDRHQGKNTNVEVTFPTRGEAGLPRDHLHDDRAGAPKQLTVNQLRKEIKTILDSLLEGCTVEFGDITFVIKQGSLEETVFSFSTKPHESAVRFFAVKV